MSFKPDVIDGREAVLPLEGSISVIPSDRSLIAMLFVLATLFSLGCASQSGQTDCNWRGDGKGTLVKDVMIAEDIAIRHADARGLTPGWRAVREQCEATLFAAVAQDHQVPENDIEEVRRQLGQRHFDWAVHPLMLLLSVALTVFTTRRLRHRFGNDLVPYFAASIFWAVFFAALVIVVGHVWSGVLEVFRIGNGHLSYRANRIPWSHQWTQVFVAVVSIFILGACGRAFTEPPPNRAQDDLISLR